MGIDAIDLKETMAANPLDKVISDTKDTTELAQEGILTAAAAETDAINQYTQILNLLDNSEDWLKQAATETIKDIIAEEKKHFGQLYMIVSELPTFKEELAAGEKETETGEDTESEKKESINDYKNSFNSTLPKSTVKPMQVTCASSNQIKTVRDKILPQIKNQLDYLKDK